MNMNEEILKALDEGLERQQNDLRAMLNESCGDFIARDVHLRIKSLGDVREGIRQAIEILKE